MSSLVPEKKYMMRGRQRWQFKVTRYDYRVNNIPENMDIPHNHDREKCYFENADGEVVQSDEYNELKKMGDEGWELINVVPVKKIYRNRYAENPDDEYTEGTDIRYYWKRPIERESEDKDWRSY